MIKNALKHTHRGQINVMSSFQPIDSLLIIHVQDSGRGIDETNLSRLFKRFGKLEDPGNLNVEGIGLGLTICEAIIRANNGEIKVHSEGIDSGTVVMFSMKMTSIPSDELS